MKKCFPCFQKATFSKTRGAFDPITPSASTLVSSSSGTTRGAFDPITPSASTLASASTLVSSSSGTTRGAFDPITPSASTLVSSSSGTTRGAFDPITPSASTLVSSSSGTKQTIYDVYINQCGEDEKQALVRRIYDSLDSMGLRVFLPKDELKHGDLLPRTLKEAITSSSSYIAIFSKNYAESPLCLAELECMVKKNNMIIPIFYHVEPSDLEWVVEGKGIYAYAFSEHEKKDRYRPEVLQRWKRALRQVSFLPGYIIQNVDDEQRAVKNVVNCLRKETRKLQLHVAEHPVGLDNDVQNFDMIALQSSGSIQIVGICGLGGCGKTTLAKEIYNKKVTSFHRSSFVSDIRDAAGKGLLVEKQKKLLKDLDVKAGSFDHVEEGKAILASCLRSVSVLIILDGVDHQDQLDAFLPAREMFGRGSLIVVTTRNVHVLEARDISAIYQMGPLSQTYAKQLFCWHAFMQPFPQSGFEDLVEEFVSALHGLPLALKVFGSQLYGERRAEYWRDILEKISKPLSHDILKRLRISYDVLDYEQKQIFLDIACFLAGENRRLAIAIWDGCELQLKRLHERCLVEIDEHSCIGMHDLLRELGRLVANEKSPYRLWSLEQNHLIKKHAEERLQVRGIMSAITVYRSCSAYHMLPNYSSPYRPPFKECLEIIHNSTSRPLACRPISLGLKFLVVRGDDFSGKFAKLSEELVWLRWFDFKDTKLPSWPSLKKLRVLELYGAMTLKELWDDDTHPPFLQLKEMNITCNWGSGLQRFPRSISDLKHLKKIALIGYLGDEFPIERLPEEFCKLEKLEHLELRHCRLLSSLPSRFGELTMLQYLDLSSCVELRVLPDSFNQLDNLEYLDFSGCRSLIFRLDFLENISKLEKVDFSGCQRLQVLPERITCQPYLRKLNMQGTRIRIMPSKMGDVKNLESLQIGSPSLTDLPSSLGNLSSLSHLTIFDCPNLKFLPDSVGNLNRLEYLRIESCGVECLPESFTNLAGLQSLEISGCPIKELDFGEGCSLSSMRSLKLLCLEDTQVSRIFISEVCCPELETLRLLQNEVLVEIVTLPKSLKEIVLWECESLKDISGTHGINNHKIQISGCPEICDSIFS